MKNIKPVFYIILFSFTAFILLQSCRKEVSINIPSSTDPVAEKLSIDSGSENTLLTLQGSGLGSIRTIVFDKGNVLAPFNPVLNTANALLFRIPAAAQNGLQNIIITNNTGAKISLPFKVLGYPVVNDISNYNFTTGTEITITGKNLLDVTSVFFAGSTTDGPSIISQTATTLVVKFPATNLARTALTVTNLTGSLTTAQEFCSYDNNFTFFIDDYQNGQQNNSWGDVSLSTTEFKVGEVSFEHTFKKGEYSQMGFGYNQISNDGYQFLTFWIKGGTVDLDLWIWSEQTEGGVDGVYDLDKNKITVPATVWTYFKVPIAPLQLWKKGPTFNVIGWRIKEPENISQKLYLDDVLLVK